MTDMTIKQAIEILDLFFERHPEQYASAPSPKFWEWFETLPKEEREPFQKACNRMAEAGDELLMREKTNKYRGGH